MKCQLGCDKEFAVMIEAHLPLEYQPIIVCRDCMEQLIFDNVEKGKITVAQAERMAKRCKK